MGVIHSPTTTGMGSAAGGLGVQALMSDPVDPLTAAGAQVRLACQGSDIDQAMFCMRFQQSCILFISHSHLEMRRVCRVAAIACPIPSLSFVIVTDCDLFSC